VTLQKSTRYALYAAFELAKAWDGPPLRAAEVAERYRLPSPALAKVFQQMVRAGLAIGTRGMRGGYRLVRRPGDLTILEVLEAFEPGTVARGSPGGTAPDGVIALDRTFQEVDEIVRGTFASITLATLLRRGPKALSST
jgi:Rrf2 family protein